MKKTKNSIKLLNEKDKLQSEYWVFKDKADKQYRKYRDEYRKHLSFCQQVSIREKRILEIVRIFKGEDKQ